jgi:hypothetical protein
MEKVNQLGEAAAKAVSYFSSEVPEFWGIFSTDVIDLSGIDPNIEQTILNIIEKERINELFTVIIAAHLGSYTVLEPIFLEMVLSELSKNIEVLDNFSGNGTVRYDLDMQKVAVSFMFSVGGKTIEILAIQTETGSNISLPDYISNLHAIITEKFSSLSFMHGSREEIEKSNVHPIVGALLKQSALESFKAIKLADAVQDLKSAVKLDIDKLTTIIETGVVTDELRILVQSEKMKMRTKQGKIIAAQTIQDVLDIY